jgi:hypothetical protein
MSAQQQPARHATDDRRIRITPYLPVSSGRVDTESRPISSTDIGGGLRRRPYPNGRQTRLLDSTDIAPSTNHGLIRSLATLLHSVSIQFPSADASYLDSAQAVSVRFVGFQYIEISALVQALQYMLTSCLKGTVAN